MNKNPEKFFVFLMLFAYAGIVAVLSFHHALWRDEVVPMSAVIGSSSLFDLFSKTHNSGHPELLVTVLYLLYHVFPFYFILKIVNISVCIAAVYIFLTCSPFSLLQKFLFIFGFFPLYLYPVFCRDYSFIMLLLFAFAALYPKRFERMIPLGLILLLLANAHAYALIITIAAAGSLTLEYLFSPEALQSRKVRPKEAVIGFALIIAGIIFSVTHIIPDHTSIYYQPHAIGFGKIVRAFIQSLSRPGEIIPTVFGVSSILFSTLIVFLVYFYLLRSPYLLLLFFSAIMGLGLFYHLIFESVEIRYQGVFYLLWTAVLWISRSLHENNSQPHIGDSLQEKIIRHKDAFFTLLLIIQICLAYPALKEEIVNDYSSSKSFGHFINQNASFKQAVLVGDPDNSLESIPYYTDNPVYLLREGRFAKYRQLTTANRQEISLAELLNTSRKLKAQTGKPLLILLGYKLSPDGPFLIKSSHHDKIFTYSKEALADFNAHTKLVGRFQKAICDENYDVYLLE